MSMGQAAIAELRKRVGKVSPVAGFRMIDDIIHERERTIDMFEQMACGWAFHQGQLVATARGYWLDGTFVDGDYAIECLSDVLKLLVDEPMLLTEPQPPEEQRLIIPGGR